jgi:acetyltransferase
MSETKIYSPDPSFDVFHWERHPLDAIFRPKTVALVGATDREGSVGRTVLENLRRDFPGAIYPVNPNRAQVLGIPAYKSLAALPVKADLAVIVTPAVTVPGVIRECVAA